MLAGDVDDGEEEAEEEVEEKAAGDSWGENRVHKFWALLMAPSLFVLCMVWCFGLGMAFLDFGLSTSQPRCTPLLLLLLLPLLLSSVCYIHV